jgi:hypothetical protein
MVADLDAPPVAPSTRFTRIATWMAVIGLAIPFVVLLIQQLAELSDRRLPCCDFAALELGTRSFLRGEQWTGLYSREGWRHLGPITFVWSALARVLPGHGFAEHQVATVMVHVVALLTVVWAFSKRLAPTAFAVAVTALVVFGWRFDIDQFREPWNPFTAMSWTMAAIVAAAMFVTRGGWKWSTAFFAVASFAVQTHVGAAPSIVVAAVVMMVVMKRRWDADGRRITLRWTVPMTIVVWSLPIVDLLGGEHNAFHVATGTDRGWASGDVWSTFVRLVGLGPSAMGRSFGTSSPYLDAGAFGVFEITSALVAVALTGVVWRARHRSPFAFGVSALSWVSILFTTVLVQITSGPFYRYLLLPVVGLSCLIWVMGLVVLVESFAGRFSAFVVPMLASAIAMTIGILTAVGVDSEHLVDRYGDADIDRAVDEVRATCGSLPESMVVEVGDVGEEIAWAEALPVIVALDRCSSVTVTGATGFIAGPGFEADDDAEVDYVIPGTGWSDIAP